MPSNTARIAKNTLMLYFRQILIMLVSLYTVRIVLSVLGAEDYGIYNVVGGVVVMFSFLNVSMASATQRFLNFALGQGDAGQVRDIYSASIVIHALIALMTVVLAQTVGLWFFYNVLNVPAERQDAAFIVYQFSVATVVVGILQVPYSATVIAHEKMSFFAWFSIVESALKLGTALLLLVIPFDLLTMFSFFVFMTRAASLMVHKVYCNKTFETAHFRLCRDKGLYRQLAGFSGWSLFGNAANVGRDQGINILLNIFHGVTTNAAVGIANQVNAAVYAFVGNFQVAFGPQIVKTYLAKKHGNFMQLIFRTSKMSFFLCFFLFCRYMSMRILYCTSG